eukprot:TRINITY_DN9960_c0_g1_i1.p1 TRINITY_DN9960_c0_g1~~TRINITY_DN9960_c0_g1_i1.p1  ORF type:complete len:546 (+),score=102.56 TRINITY_DN9960_c0_g1_i1:42-1679(+)
MPPVKRARSEGPTTDTPSSELSYHHGFGNAFLSECLPDVVPRDQNSPQRCNYGLYAELLSGCPFTAPRKQNLRVWFYRIHPSVKHGPFRPLTAADRCERMILPPCVATPEQYRWRPHPLPPQEQPTNFLQGLVRYAGAGDPSMKAGVNVYVYAFNRNMTSNTPAGGGSSAAVGAAAATSPDRGDKRAFVNADGDMLVVPQQGALMVHTEHGRLRVDPQEVVVIPRNVAFSIDHAPGPSPPPPSMSSCSPSPAVGGTGSAASATTTTGTKTSTSAESSSPAGPWECRGYVAECYDGHFVLPERSVLGTSGLADERHFHVPTAHYVDDTAADDTATDGVGWRVVHKYLDSLHAREQQHCPFDVVGWHGNYYPFKYDLRRFCVINTVSFDHMDPSIFCVFSVMTNTPGMAALDFVIFPPRWGVQENTFRPPYFHRNVMAEFMGLITGSYEAKKGTFVPGGASLHSVSAPHGPDLGCFKMASTEELVPQRVADGTMAFMFETGYLLKLTEWAAAAETVDPKYHDCWQHTKAFDPKNRAAWDARFPADSK